MSDGGDERSMAGLRAPAMAVPVRAMVTRLPGAAVTAFVAERSVAVVLVVVVLVVVIVRCGGCVPVRCGGCVLMRRPGCVLVRRRGCVLIGGCG